jgi:hypothetical protein
VAQNTSELIRQAREALKSPQRQAQERHDALVESGRDPFAEQLQGMIPINRATRVAKEDGRLSGIASLAGDTIMGAGTVRAGGPEAAGWLRNMARRIAGTDQSKQHDLIQTAMEAVAREGGTLNPRNAMRQSKSSMLMAERPQGGVGARKGLAHQISKIQGKLGDVGDFRMRSELNKLRPADQKLSLDQVRKARSKVGLRAHQRPGSLDDLENVARGVDNPETAAVLQQGIDRLTPQQQLNLRKHMSGEKINPAILKRIQDKFKGGKTAPAKPISGGAGTPNLQLEPKMQAIQDQLTHFLDKTYPPGQKLSPPWMAESDVPAQSMSGVTNPYHPEFVALQDSAPKVSRALQRVGDQSEFGLPGRVTFEDLPREAFMAGDNEAWGQSASLASPTRSIAINRANNAPRSTPIHEALHTLYQMTKKMNQPTSDPGTAITLWPGRPARSEFDSILSFPRGQDAGYGMRLLEGMYSNEPGHAAIERMTNNILRSTGQQPVYRRNP